MQSFNGVASGTFPAPDHEYPSYLELELKATDSGGLTDTRTFTLRVGNANTAVSCTVPAGNTGCTSTQSITIPPGSLISIGSTSTGAPDPTDVRFGWRLAG